MLFSSIGRVKVDLVGNGFGRREYVAMIIIEWFIENSRACVDILPQAKTICRADVAIVKSHIVKFIYTKLISRNNKLPQLNICIENTTNFF